MKKNGLPASLKGEEPELILVSLPARVSQRHFKRKALSYIELKPGLRTIPLWRGRCKKGRRFRIDY